MKNNSNATCYHGGAFFDAIGDEFENLSRHHDIINADVLDAWFPPSPKVLAALDEDLPWLLRTSPPTNCEGLQRVIARTRGVMPENILPGGGSSDLIFLALRHWLTPSSRVLILDPMYGEYAHVLEKVIRCHVSRFTLSRDENYRINLGELEKEIQRGYDLVILVNPNSPTGQFVPQSQLKKIFQQILPKTRVWIDETYIEYAGANQSLERFATNTENIVVCKSMSKVYALSGARAAYLCGATQIIDELRPISPPWSVSLPAQVAAVAALQDSDYYAQRWTETHELREHLASQLAGFDGWEIIPGIANFLLCHLPEDELSASEIVSHCREHGLFLRDVGSMGQILGSRVLRIAVKDEATNQRMISILEEVVAGSSDKLSEKMVAMF